MKTAPVSALPGMLLRDAAGVGTTGEEAVTGVVDGGVKMSSGLDDEGCVAAARTALLSGLQQPSTVQHGLITRDCVDLPQSESA